MNTLYYMYESIWKKTDLKKVENDRVKAIFQKSLISEYFPKIPKYQTPFYWFPWGGPEAPPQLPPSTELGWYD